jgi:hypothetical protein
MVTLPGGLSMGKGTSDLARLLPDTLQGWKVRGEDKRYSTDTLYDYIDGGAELYLSYGFKGVVNRTYVKPNQPDMVVDIFDMDTSQNAYGVFSHSMETVETTFGQGSQSSEGLVLFWKGPYYISIMAHPETPESKKALFDLAKKIDGAIVEEGPLPSLLNLLPERALAKESIRSFHHHAWLNSHYFIADQNILNIDDHTTDALLAKYGEGKNRSLLLLVQYMDDIAAQRAYTNFLRQYLPELSQKQSVQIEDGTWTACHLAGNLLIAVFNAPKEDGAVDLIKRVEKRLVQKGEDHEK